jgi:glycosyltransferase involved in cell wall biosynthesis
MRILIITNYYPPAEIGGWEQLTYDVVDELVLRGHKIHVITSDHSIDRIAEPEPNVSRVLNLESPDHVNYHLQYLFSHRRQERGNINNLFGIVGRFDPDIIYINGMWNLPHSLAQAAEQIIPGRVVYYMASYWPTEMDAHTAYWSSPAENGIRRFSKSTLGQFFRQYIISGRPRNQLDFRLVLCVSNYIQNYMIEEAKVPREQTRVVHNGIDMDFFKLKPESTEYGRMRLLYAGRLSPDKGVHTILESLAIINRDGPAINIDCSIYGSGAPEYHSKLVKYAADNELEEWVHFRGVVPREEMPDVFADHDVLLFPSIWAEPLARIIQEAMACGLVVIGTNTGGTDEILLDGITGFTFEAENAHMLAEKIIQVLENEDLREKIAQEARRKVDKEFSLSRMVDDIEESFKSVLIEEAPALG